MRKHRFRYTARDPMKRKVEGELSAADTEDAARQLAGMMLEPIRIEPVGPEAPAAAAPRPVSAEALGTPAGGETPAASFPPPLAEEVARSEEEEASARRRNAILQWIFALAFLVLYQIIKCG